MIFLNRICAPRCLCGILETYVNISAHRRFSQRTEWRPYNSNLKRLSALTYVIENIPNKINLCPFINMTTCRSISNIAPSADTIFALSSGHGKCGVAVIRVSGPAAVTALKDMGRFTKLPPNKTAILRKLVHPSSREAIDKGLVLWFPGPHSFTGEDCVEFHVHGGPAILVAMVTALSSIPGLRQAEAGEFSKRAFINGKMDLTCVEGLGDLIHAETEAQRKQALRQMDGDLGQLYSAWRQTIMKVTADMEAQIDFGEDYDIDDSMTVEATDSTRALLQEIQDHLKDNRQGERLRNGVHVTIIGEPNVGKSSLLNKICQRQAAIVSHIPGTTRDVVETHLDIGGYPVVLNDTAGLRSSEDIIEQEGIRRALKRSQHADINILVTDIQSFSKAVEDAKFDLQSTVKSHLHELGVLEETSSETSSMKLSSRKFEFLNKLNKDSCDNELPTLDGKLDLDSLILILNKSDLVDSSEALLSWNSGDLDVCIMSCKTGDGLQQFLHVLTEKVKKMCGNPLVGSPSLTQARHRALLHNCVVHLMKFFTYMEARDIVLATHCLRKTIHEFGKLTGKITSEDILDIIFRDFCIGK